MRVRNMVVAVTGAALLTLPATAMGDALIGQFDNGNNQGVNSTQSGLNGSGSGEFTEPGLKFIDGNSTPHTSQGSTNVASNDAIIGGPGGDGTLIGNGNQQNTQGIDSTQKATKGTQRSTNVSTGTQIIGLTTGDAIIGNPTQVNDQGTNSLQTSTGRAAGILAILGPVNKGPETQTSANILDSCEVVIGGAAGTC